MAHVALLLASSRPTWPDVLVFAAAAAVILVGSVGVVTSRNPVHAALSLVMTLFGVAVLFIEQEADFLAAVQIIVYAGAIVVLFLFVIMFLGVDREENVGFEPLRGQRPLAVGLVILGTTGLLLLGQVSRWTTGAPHVAGSDGGPQSNNVNLIGKSVFTTYLFPFEATAALLVIAVVGAVVLARRPRNPESGGADHVGGPGPGAVAGDPDRSSTAEDAAEAGRAPDRVTGADPATVAPVASAGTGPSGSAATEVPTRKEATG